MKIFLSWSKSKSKEIAISMKKFLEGLFRNDIDIWMSSESINYGTMSIPQINSALANSDKCIVFITQENINAPWIMYETGAIATQNYQSLSKNYDQEIIIPIIFDNIVDSKFVGNPLNQFQRLQYNRTTILRLVKQLNVITKSFSNESTLENQFGLNWSVLNKEIKAILNKYSISGHIPLTCKFLTEALDSAGFTVPCYGDITYYDSGFETQKLYEILLNNAEKRLWILGRKNRKLFSTENRTFFEDLKRRQKNGFDFRCLFLNPFNKDLHKFAQRGSNFSGKLEMCIEEAKSILESNDIEFGSVCKFYDCERTEHLIVIDNVIIYSHINYLNDNFPSPLTKAPFYVVDVDNSIGQSYMEKFNEIWKSTTSLNCVTA